jgi:hypothetical protein
MSTFLAGVVTVACEFSYDLPLAGNVALAPRDMELGDFVTAWKAALLCLGKAPTDYTETVARDLTAYTKDVVDRCGG